MKFYSWHEIPREKLSKGIERQMLWGEKAMICRFIIDPHVEIRTHAHKNEQYTMILKGRALINLDGIERELKEGDVVYIPANKPHGLKVLDEGLIALDVFCPPRRDFINGSDRYLR